MVRTRQRSWHWVMFAWLAWLGLAMAPALSTAMKAAALGGSLGPVCSAQDALVGVGSAPAMGDVPAGSTLHDDCGFCLLAAGHAMPPPATGPAWMPAFPPAAFATGPASALEQRPVWSLSRPRGPPTHG